MASLWAQNPAGDTLKLSRAEAEAIFLKQNLQLLATRLGIDEARARLVQARAWPNPTLSIGEVNFWSNPSAETLPPLAGNWGKHQEVTAQLEQVIRTASKRKKLMAIEQVNVQHAEAYFEDVLRTARAELHQSITRWVYYTKLEALFAQERSTITRLAEAYKKQAGAGNISTSEYMRLRTREIQFLKSLHEIRQQLNELQADIQQLLGMATATPLVFVETDMPDAQRILSTYSTQKLVDMAIENRPDVLITQLGEQRANALLAYERAQRTPDLALSMSYDRGGNMMRDFVGFGLSMDLPILNRNKGNIEAARVGQKLATLHKDHQLLALQVEANQRLNELRHIQSLKQEFQPEYEETMDALATRHHENFSRRNISMLVYFDFVDSYIESKSLLYETDKNLRETLLEIELLAGKSLHE